VSLHPPIHVIDGLPDARQLGDDVGDFLRELGGPTLLRLPGRDRGRLRAVATLLHGNEPSGVVALHRWLRSAPVPAVDVWCFIGSVEAALEPPGFAHRMLPGHPDQNRCFAPPWDDSRETAIARDLLRHLDGSGCESLVDLHNNSGHSPPYGVVMENGPTQRALVALFARQCVLYDLHLGTLSEATGWMPSVTIECGRAGDPAAVETAFAGLARYAISDELFGADGPDDMRVYHHPVQVRLRDGLHVAFADTPVPGADLTLRLDLDRHNFEQVAAGAELGWVLPDGEWPLIGRDGRDRDVSRDLFVVDGTSLRARGPMVPIMMTTNARIAASDCLCYLVQPMDDEETR
jgi:hypothetical protein